jgi:ABC-type antimicrobial peptide transport system permease subunit
VVYLSYMLSELRRRKGRTLLTALGLALGVGVASAAQSAFGGPGGPGDPFGQGAVDTSAASQAVSLTTHVSIGLIALAVALALLAGFVSGAVGGLRTSHLRPADVLRHID